jgi:AraC-like DNA-binding protein
LVDEAFDVGVAREFAVDDRKVNYADAEIHVFLRFSDRSIKEIAVDYGFSSLSTFGKFVKMRLGLSPRAYRREGALSGI